MLYSIEDTTLTAIADAIRSKLGEESSGGGSSSEIIEYAYPSFVDNSGTGNVPPLPEEDYDPFMTDALEEEMEITIPGAVQLEVNLWIKMMSDENQNYVEVDGNRYYSDGEMMGEYDVEGTERLETLTIDGETIQFFYMKDRGEPGGYGYFAEVRGLDENGEYIEGTSGGGSDTGMTPLEMPDKIINIPEGWPEPNLQMIEITENGEYMPDGFDGYNHVIVNVASSGGSSFPEEVDLGSSTLQYWNQSGAWDFVIEAVDKLTIKTTGQATYVLGGSKLVDFSKITFAVGSMHEYFMNGNEYMEIAPNIYLKDSGGSANIRNAFQNNYRLKELPNDLFKRKDENGNLLGGWALDVWVSSGWTATFGSCYALRNIPELPPTHTANNHLRNTFSGCWSLDEIIGVPVNTGTGATYDLFDGTFSNCSRAKDIIFAVQEDGTPYTATWQNQCIDLSNYVGYASSDSLTYYNGDFTEDNRVTDESTYEYYREDPDWWTTELDFSRYNHDSAVNTINSLPDVSGGSGNSIKFKSGSGAMTEAGSVDDLTEDEIAVATAKGWTVTFV